MNDTQQNERLVKELERFQKTLEDIKRLQEEELIILRNLPEDYPVCPVLEWEN